MSLGISRKAVNLLNEVFENNIGVIKAILYGSEIIGSYKPGGDIELAIVGDLNLEELKKIAREIQLLKLPYKFDLCLYHQLEDLNIKNHIDKVGSIIYIGRGKVLDT
jgi:predicted nucleotidyltransferase